MIKMMNPTFTWKCYNSTKKVLIGEKNIKLSVMILPTVFYISSYNQNVNLKNYIWWFKQRMTISYEKWNKCKSFKYSITKLKLLWWKHKATC